MRPGFAPVNNSMNLQTEQGATARPGAYARQHRRGIGELTVPEMTDEEARQQVERTDRFIAAFRELIASTVVDPASPCEVACHRGLERIAATVDAVDYVVF